MDPTATLKLFLAATIAGDLDEAAQAASDYRAWLLRDGFPAQVERAGDILAVSVLDVEQDRIGVCPTSHDARYGTVERWISVEAMVDLAIEVIS